MLHAQRPIYEMCTDGSIPIYPKHEFIKLFPLGYFPVAGADSLIATTHRTAPALKVFLRFRKENDTMLLMLFLLFTRCLSLPVPWFLLELRYVFMWCGCSLLKFSFRSDAQFSGTYLLRITMMVRLQRTAAKICHVDLFLLNCGCWVYTRVNSFTVFVVSGPRGYSTEIMLLDYV